MMAAIEDVTTARSTPLANAASMARVVPSTAGLTISE
jgi:hypothetical protein